MGLDMYLSKRTYIGANYDHSKITGTVNLNGGDEQKPINIKLKRVSEIIERVGYWRKANAIHNWFVQNVQDGEDNCQETYVSTEQLITLLNLCKEVLKDNSKAEELLPVKSGFFFGGTEYDEWYFTQIQDTIDIIEPLLNELESEEKNTYTSGDIYYQSSW